MGVRVRGPCSLAPVFCGRVLGGTRNTVMWLALPLACLSQGCFQDGGVTVVIDIAVEATPIYFKAHKWGRNGFSAVLSLSRDSSRVPSPSDWECCPDDFTWPADSPPILVFRREEASLHLWDSSPGGWRPPAQGPLSSRVVIHLVDVLELQRMIENPSRYGVTVLQDGTLPYAPPPVEPTPLNKVAINDVGSPQNNALQLTKPAQAMELRS